MYSIDRLPNVIDIGYSGEKDFRSVEIDLTSWMETMPDGVPSIVYIRPGDSADDAYIVATTFEDNILTWIVSDSDVGVHEGTGTAQIWLEKENADNEIVKRGKSALVAVRVKEALNDPDATVPAVQEVWLEQMTALKTATVNANADAQTAKTAAEAAQTASETAQGKAEDAQAAAEAAQILAEAAQGDAETAQGKAEDAQEAAESARDTILAMSATATGLAAGSDPTATYSNGVMAFGIPKGDKGDKGDTGNTGAAGQDGEDAYVYIRYSASQPTQDSDMKTDPDAWMGIYAGSSSTAPTQYTAYTWYKIKGADGAGTVAGIKMNNQTVQLDQDNIADLGTVITDVSDKVDKVTGKGLSTEDYTTAEKTKLGGLTEATLRPVPVSLAVGDWSGSGTSYTATFTSAYVTSTSKVFMLVSDSIEDYGKSISDLACEATTGGIIFYADALPTGVISGTAYVLDNDDGKIPVIIEGTVVPIANGGTGESSVAGVQSAFGIGDLSTLHTSAKTNLVAATNELSDQIATSEKLTINKDSSLITLDHQCFAYRYGKVVTFCYKINVGGSNVQNDGTLLHLTDSNGNNIIGKTSNDGITYVYYINGSSGAIFFWSTVSGNTGYYFRTGSTLNANQTYYVSGTFMCQ